MLQEGKKIMKTELFMLATVSVTVLEADNETRLLELSVQYSNIIKSLVLPSLCLSVCNAWGQLHMLPGEGRQQLAAWALHPQAGSQRQREPLNFKTVLTCGCQSL